MKFAWQETMNAIQRTTRVAAILVATASLIQGCAGIRLDRGLREAPYDWLTFGGAASRVNQSGSVAAPPLQAVWEYNALAGIRGTPLVKDSVVLVVTLSGEIQAVHLTTGERVGYMVLQSAVAGTPVWDSSFAYVPCALGSETLTCIGLRNAERRWARDYGSIESSLLLHGELLYVTTLDGIFYCIKKSDGMELWKFETAEKGKRKPIRSSPASDGTAITFGSDDAYLYAVERTSGKLRWKYQTGASIFATPVIAHDICVVGSLDGLVYALQMGTGKLLWKYDTRSKIYAEAAAAADSVVYIGSADGQLHALRIDSGARLWSFSAGSVISSAPLIAGDVLYVGSLDRILYALNRQTGEKLWQYEAPGRIRVSPVIWGDVLLLTSEDKFITAMRPAQP
ncbi:MAG: hypothetical protein FJ217_02095 [Ignavibacteria bacterium]|nr:hypothetical protein [Ignavibacteria bacterium]